MNKLEEKTIIGLLNSRRELYELSGSDLSGPGILNWINNKEKTFTQANTLWGGLLSYNLSKKIEGFEKVSGKEAEIVRENVVSVLDDFIKKVNTESIALPTSDNDRVKNTKIKDSFVVSVAYGPLPQGLSFDFSPGYSVVTGQNNAGKSAIIQYIFKTLIENRQITPDKYEFFEWKLNRDKYEQIVLLLPERMHVNNTTQANITLQDFNIQLYQSLKVAPRVNVAGLSPNFSSVSSSIIDSHDRQSDISKLRELLSEFGLSDFVERTNQEIHFQDDDKTISVRGSGQRNIFSILAALVNPLIRVVLIDEPEIGLEPRLQKKLRELFYEYSKEKTIIIVTHSHIFLNQKNPENNYSVIKKDGSLILRKETKESLADVVFDLLGCSVEDLFFPENYIIVEGASDQIIIEKILMIIDEHKAKKVKVICANGITRTDNVYGAIEDNLRPIVAGSPYKNKVVVLIDKPQNSAEREISKKIKKCLGENMIQLGVESLEKYLPETLYLKANLDKAAEIERLKKSNKDEKFIIKKMISTKISEVIEESDIESTPELKSAAIKALSF